MRRQSRRTGGSGEGMPGDPPTDQAFWETSPVVELAARNLTLGRPWWKDFSAIRSDKEQMRQFDNYEYLLRQRGPGQIGGIGALVAHPEAFTDDAARSLVEACHETWRRRMGALAERARDRGESFPGLIEREQERWRITFSHCKNAATLRAALIDFWSRAGSPLPTLQKNWQSLLQFFTPDRWDMARDLALLSLVSYSAKGSPSQPEGLNEASSEEDSTP